MARTALCPCRLNKVRTGEDRLKTHEEVSAFLYTWLNQRLLCDCSASYPNRSLIGEQALFVRLLLNQDLSIDEIENSLLMVVDIVHSRYFDIDDLGAGYETMIAQAYACVVRAIDVCTGIRFNSIWPRNDRPEWKV